MMKLDVKQQEAVMEALRIQQRAEREQIERYRLAPPAIRSKRYRLGFLLGATLLGTSCFALWYFVGLAFYPLLPVVLTGTALSGWLRRVKNVDGYLLRAACIIAPAA